MKNLSSRLLFLVLSSLISLPSFTNPQFPLKIVENNRYLTDQNNVPFYWLGDTEWDIFRDFTLADAETLLENRAEKGFSVIQTMIFGVSGGTRPNLMGEKPFIKDDPEKPNEAFFKFVDSVIEIANNKGLIVVLGIYHKSDDYGRLITMKNARTWARWIG